MAAIAAAILLGLSAAAARAQEAPLMVQTVPSLQDIELTAFGAQVMTDGHGLAVATGAPGTYELTAPASGAKEDVRWEFSGWSDGIDSPTRPVSVTSFTFLEAGYDVYHRVDLSLVTAGGEELPDPLDSAALIDDRGRRVTLSGGEPTWLLAQRAVQTPSGLAPEEVGYLVQSISAGGRRLFVGGEQRLRPDAGGLIEIEVAAPQVAGAPQGSAKSDPSAPGSSSLESRPMWPFVVLGAAALGLLTLAVHSRGAGWTRAGTAAVAGAGRTLGQKLSPVASGTAAAARHAGTGAVNVLRRSARGGLRLAGDGAGAGRIFARRSASRLSLMAGAATAGGRIFARRSASRLSLMAGAATGGGRSFVRRAATAAGRAAGLLSLWWSVGSRAAARALAAVRRIAVSAPAVTAARARVARTVIVVRLDALGAAARATARSVSSGLRGVRVFAGVRAIAIGAPRVATRGSRSRARRGPGRPGESVAAARYERELVRVTLFDGRVVEGWWERQAASTSDFFCLTNVTRVLEADGTDTASTPVDAFIPVAKIADIERAEAAAREDQQGLPRAAGAGRADRLSSSPG